MLVVGIDERPVNVKDGNGRVCHSRPLPANPVPNRAVIRKGQARSHEPAPPVRGRAKTIPIGLNHNPAGISKDPGLAAAVPTWWCHGPDRP
jgi:hypothetical protein